VKYDVGNILWVVGTERPGLRVYRVVEEVIKKSLSGTETTYRLQSAGTKRTSQIVSIETIDGEIFDSAEQAQNFMLDSAKNAIQNMVDKAEMLINKCWPEDKEEIPPKTKEQNRTEKVSTVDNNISDEEDYHYVELENGTKARIKMPNF
tara:strand:- start:2469 stop:2915 length:447 start_codon:yes stop_codon:yes gene_type:complete